MSRVLLSGFRLRIGDSNNAPAIYNGIPYRMRFYDSTTSQPKSVYAGPETFDVSLGSIVDLDGEGYVPPSGVWLDVGLYNIHVQRALINNPVDDDLDWGDVWNINKVQGGIQDSIDSDTTIRFVSTVASIRALSGAELSGITINTGYYTLSDGGQGMWRWVSNSLQADDGGSVLMPSGQSSVIAGRWHRIFETAAEYSVRLWGVIPNQPDVSGNMTNAINWAKRTGNDTCPTLAFPAGSYTFGGAYTMQGTGLTSLGIQKQVSFHVYPNANFILPSSVALIFSGPTIIDSKDYMINQSANLIFDKGSVPFVRPEWWPREFSYANRMQLASDRSSGIVIHVDNGLSNSSNAGEVLAINAPVKFFNGSTVAPASGAIIRYNKRITSENDYAPIFCNVDSSNNVTIPNGTTVINSNTRAYLQWFGYGLIAGTNQTSAMQYAASSLTNDSGNLISSAIYVSGKINPTKQIEGTVNTGSYTMKLEFEYPIKISSTGVLGTVTVKDVDGQRMFDMASSGSILSINNPFIRPEWFGMGMVNASSHTSIMNAVIRTGAKNRCPIIGGGQKWEVQSPITYTAASSEERLTLRDIGLYINPTVNYTSNYLMSIGGNCDIVFNQVEMESYHDTNKNIECLRATNYFQRYDNCVIGGGLTITAADLVFTHNQCYAYGRESVMVGSEHIIFNTHANAIGQIITDNTFGGLTVLVRGQTSITSGETNPFIKGVNITNNVFRANGSTDIGVLNIQAMASNTVVGGLNVIGNSFTGYIKSSNESDRIRIKSSVVGSGSFYNSSSPIFAYIPKHSINIKDNTVSKVLLVNSGNAIDGPIQYCPSTEGYHTSINSLTSGTSYPVTNIHNDPNDTRNNAEIIVTAPAPTNFFILYGDTSSNVFVSIPSGGYLSVVTSNVFTEYGVSFTPIYNTSNKSSNTLRISEFGVTPFRVSRSIILDAGSLASTTGSLYFNAFISIY